MRTRHRNRLFAVSRILPFAKPSHKTLGAFGEQCLAKLAVNHAGRLPIDGEKMNSTVVVYTGNGRGKSSAAAAAVLRTLGHGKKAAYIQFMKGTLESGERNFFNSIDNELLVYAGGIGFFTEETRRSEQTDAAQRTFRIAQEAVYSKKFSLVVLDELNYALHYGLLEEELVLNLIKDRGDCNIIISGRYAKQSIIEAADTVSEIVEIKHGYNKGIPAIKGIDY